MAFSAFASLAKLLNDNFIKLKLIDYSFIQSTFLSYKKYIINFF